MKRQTQTLILSLALMALPLTQATAAEKPPVKLAKVFPYLEQYLSIPPADRNRFSMSYAFMMNGKPAAGLKAVIVEADGRRTPLIIGPTGRVTTLPNSNQLKSAQFIADVSAGAKMGVNLEMLPSMAVAKEISAREAELSIAQVNAGIAKAAGAMSFAAPKMTGLTFVGSGQGVARLANGKETPLPLDKGVPFYDPGVTKGAVTIVLAKTPTKLDFKSK